MYTSTCACATARNARRMRCPSPGSARHQHRWGLRQRKQRGGAVRCVAWHGTATAKAYCRHCPTVTAVRARSPPHARSMPMRIHNCPCPCTCMHQRVWKHGKQLVAAGMPAGRAHEAGAGQESPCRRARSRSAHRRRRHAGLRSRPPAPPAGWAAGRVWHPALPAAEGHGHHHQASFDDSRALLGASCVCPAPKGLLGVHVARAHEHAPLPAAVGCRLPSAAPYLRPLFRPPGTHVPPPLDTA